MSNYYLRIILLAGLCLMLNSCATVMSGTTRYLEVKSPEQTLQAKIDDIDLGKTPVQIRIRTSFKGFNNSRPKTTRSLTLYNQDTLVYKANLYRKSNPWVWGNGVFFYAGVLGFCFDYLAGSAYRYELGEEVRYEAFTLPVEVKADVPGADRGNWHKSLGYIANAKFFSDNTEFHSTESEIGLELLAGHKQWYYDLAFKVYLYSPQIKAHSWELLAVGLHTRLPMFGGRISPYIQSGISLMAGSTQNNKGAPVGVWGDAGLAIKLSSLVSLHTFAGYSKGETTVSGPVNTDGPKAGITIHRQFY